MSSPPPGPEARPQELNSQNLVPVVLFDGECGICAWCAEIARRIDGRGRFAIEPYQRFDDRQLAQLGVTRDQCARELQVIARRGASHPGAYGINFFLWSQFPWRLVVVLIYAIPILLLLEIAAYRVVAVNRHRISAFLGMGGCGLPHS